MSWSFAIAASSQQSGTSHIQTRLGAFCSQNIFQVREYRQTIAYSSQYSEPWTINYKMKLLWLLVLGLCGSVYGQPGGKPIFSAKDDVDERDLACAACLAVIDIVDKAMEKKSFDGVESRLYDVIENVCDQKNFPAYDFIPPKMVDACKNFVDKVDQEELMTLLQRYYSKSEDKRPERRRLERKICVNVSGDCVGNKRVEVKEKKSYAEKVAEAAELDEQFDVDVDDLIKKQGGKLRQPEPQKHTDEL